MTSAILIGVVGLIYFAVALDQFCVQQNFWNGIIWAGYAIAQTGLYNLTVRP